MNANIDTAAKRLRDAGDTGRACAPVRDLIAEGDLEGAYAVQAANTDFALAQGRILVGRKIGLTSFAVQKQLGVDQPDFGMLFQDMLVSESHPIPTTELMQPKIEAEVALVLKSSLNRQSHSIADIIDATDYALPALEIVGSRIANWDITIVDTIADNASSGKFVLGAQKVSLSDFDPVACGMTMTRNEVEVSVGNGAACMGNPLIAAAWLADMMVRLGSPLSAGDIILTGALGPMVAVSAGDSFRAEITGLGSVSASFA